MVSMAVLLLRFLQDTVITMVSESHLALQGADRAEFDRVILYRFSHCLVNL
jgi:hypothetical protein